MTLLTDVRTRFERLLPLGWMAVGMVFLYVLWILISRDLAVDRRVPPAEPLLSWLCGSEPKILAFYSSPSMVRGEPGTICYGVLNVKSVRLDPPVEQITPSINRCIAVTPARTTSYTLYADGNDGRMLTASFTVLVQPPPPSFLFVDISAKQIVRGDRFSLCYGVKNAVSVKLEPAMPMPTPPVAKHCIMFYPQVSMDLRLTATGEDGRVEILKSAVKVISRNMGG